MGWPRMSVLEARIDELMDRLTAAGDDHARRAPVLAEYLQARGCQGVDETFDIGANSEDLADRYLALGKADDAVRTVRDATAEDYREAAVMLCDLAEKLMRSGHEPQARAPWERVRADYPDDVWVHAQVGIEYDDLGDHATALSWLPRGWSWGYVAVIHSRRSSSCTRCAASALSALGREPDVPSYGLRTTYE